MKSSILIFLVRCLDRQSMMWCHGVVTAFTVLLMSHCHDHSVHNVCYPTFAKKFRNKRVYKRFFKNFTGTFIISYEFLTYDLRTRGFRRILVLITRNSGVMKLELPLSIKRRLHDSEYVARQKQLPSNVVWQPFKFKSSKQAVSFSSNYANREITGLKNLARIPGFVIGIHTHAKCC